MFAFHLEGTELDRYRLQFPRQADISGSGDVNDLLQLVVFSLKGFIICRQFLDVCVEGKQSGHISRCTFTFLHVLYRHNLTSTTWITVSSVTPPVSKALLYRPFDGPVWISWYGCVVSNLYSTCQKGQECPAYLNGGPPFFLNVLEFALVPLLVWIVDSVPFSPDRREACLVLISPLSQLLLELLHLFVAYL